MSTPYVIALLLSITVFLILYFFLVPRKNFKDFSHNNDNTFIRIANILGDELYSAIPSHFSNHYNKKHPKINSLLKRSGNPWKINEQEFIFITILSLAVGSIIGTVIGFITYSSSNFPIYILTLGGACGGFFMPYAILKEKADSRENSFRRELPEALDLITISLAGGKTFQMALRESVPNMNDSLLKEEFKTILSSLDTSRPLHDCLEDFKNRAPNENIRVFVQAVQESLALDVPLVHVLRSRAEDSRQELFYFIQGKIAELPTKLMSVLTPTITIALLIITASPAGFILMNSL